MYISEISGGYSLLLLFYCSGWGGLLFRFFGFMYIQNWRVSMCVAGGLGGAGQSSLFLYDMNK